MKTPKKTDALATRTPRRSGGTRHRTRNRTLGSLVLLLAIIVVIAQLAGASLRRPSHHHRAPAAKTLATLADAPVPDITSTRIGPVRKISAHAGDTVKMSGHATMRLRRSARAGAEVVCGLRYARTGDPSWTMGVPYDSKRLTRRHAVKRITMTRTFAAPATDTYTASYACHVASPRSGARVTATGNSTLRNVS